MDIDGLPLIGPGLDYTKVGAIQQKRTLAFVNHFLTNTVSFLNKFSRSCEMKLEKFEEQIQKLEASLSILEAKLSSIPGLDNVTPPQALSTSSLPDANQSVAEDIDKSTVLQNHSREEENKPLESTKQAPALEQQKPKEEVKSQGLKASQDPTFARYFRMVQVGVPLQAVRLKMKNEGLDPNILDNPDALVPASTKQEKSEDSSDEDSESSFSE